jgi:hypothetical protein
LPAATDTFDAEMPDPPKKVLISLCERALAGDIWLDELERIWPEPAEDPNLASLGEALEDAITHTPGYLLRRGINVRAGERSPEYADVEAHLDIPRSEE